MLYLFWRSDDDDNQTAEQFTQTLVGTLNALRDRVHLNSSSSDNLQRRADSLSNKNDSTNGASEEVSSEPPTCSVYLVIDRQGTETALAEQLARTASSHPILRQHTEGITVGVASHPRAAPGLEAIVEAILVGNRDRRNLSQSLLGVLSPHPEHLLGLQDPQKTDAAQGVQQSLICARVERTGQFANVRSSRSYGVALAAQLAAAHTTH